MTGVYIGIAILVVLLIYIFATYNGFVKMRNRVKEAFSTMDVCLKKRWDLIPNIVEVVKGYVKHEQDTFTELTKIRSGVYDNMTDEEKVASSNKIAAGLSKVMALAEAYPDLKASTNFRDLSGQLSQVEEEIAKSRKYYNGCIRVYNNKIQMVPSNIVAKLFGFKAEKMFEISLSERENVSIEL